MKKALIVTSVAGFIRGFLTHDIQLLQEMGYEVHCAANANVKLNFDPASFFGERNVIFHQIDFSSVKPFSKETLHSYKQIKGLLKEEKFDFIHCHTPIVGLIVRMAARRYRRKGCKVVYTTHGLAFPKGCGIKDKLIYGTAEWLGARMCDTVITINRDDFDTMKRVSPKRTSVYYINGVGVNIQRYRDVSIDRDEYRKSIGVEKDDVMILSVGELSKRKNQQIIIKALAKINDPKYVFVICGTVMTGNTAYEHMVKLAKELNVRVEFLGFRSDIPMVCHCADIAVMPSVREGLGLAGIQALCAGVPVIGSSVQGIKDYVIDGKTGYLCSPYDADAFAQRILELTDKSLCDSMRQNCLEKAEEFSAEISFKQMNDIYKEVTG